MLKKKLLKKVLTAGILALAMVASNTTIFTSTPAIAHAEAKAMDWDEQVAIEARCAKWKYASGSYHWDKGSEFYHKTLQMVNITDRALVYELHLYQGNAEEETDKHLVYRGIINLDQQGVGHSYLGDKEIHFDLEENRNYVVVTHEATTPFDIAPGGVMENIGEPSYYLEFFTLVLEYLPEKATGLSADFSKYEFKEVHYKYATAYSPGFTIIEARKKRNGKLVAKYAVADDMSEIYRDDNTMSEIFKNGILIHSVNIAKG